MSDHDGGARVSLTEIASRVPGVLADMPVIVRGAVTGLLPQRNSKKSIGTVFQERAARYGDRVFLRFGDQRMTYREANATANRYAAVLAARGVGHGDVVAIMLRNSPNAVLVMLAAVKCGAIAGMLNLLATIDSAYRATLTDPPAAEAQLPTCCSRIPPSSSPSPASGTTGPCCSSPSAPVSPSSTNPSAATKCEASPARPP